MAPRRRADLALPADVPLTHVLPGLLQAASESDSGTAATPGWALQRIGGPPLDIGQSLDALGVLDGEVLYLRPQQAHMPPAAFDDVADVVATGVKEGPGQWTPVHTRRAGLGAAAALLGAGPVILALTGPPWLVAAVMAGMFSIILVVAGGLLSRAGGDSGAGALLGYVALPYGFFSGLTAPAGQAELLELGAPHLLAGCAVAALVATIGGVTVGDGIPGFLGAAVAALTGLVGSAIVMMYGVPPAGVAAVAIAILITFSTLIPMLSFRLGRLPMPSMPTNAEELRSDRQEVHGPTVLERTAHARGYATGLVAGVAMVALAAEVFLALEPGPLAAFTLLLLSLVLLMRARTFQGLGQRIWLITTAMAGLIMFAVGRFAGGGIVEVILAMLLLPWLAAIPAAIGLWLPRGQKPSPFWGRAGDIVEFLLIMGLFPLALGVLDLYGWARGLFG